MRIAQQPDRGRRWIPTQHVAVRQLYVPGLYLQGHDTPLYESVFAQPIEVSALASCAAGRVDSVRFV